MADSKHHEGHAHTRQKRTPCHTKRRAKKLQLSAGAKLCLEVVKEQIVLAEQVPEAEITWHKDGRPVVTGWTGFDAAKAVREMRADQVARLDAPFRR